LDLSEAIDCDIHPALPTTDVLLPYLDDYWREMVPNRMVADLTLASYPPTVPLSGRPDWRPGNNRPGTDFAMLQRQALDGFGTRRAICNVVHGAPAMVNDDFAAALCRAINDWLSAEWLDRDPRLRASIVVPFENAELAVEEIERCASDRRFVQVLMLAMAERPLGRRSYWPIYRAAARHDLPIGIHAGSTGRNAPTALGWPSHFIQDYVANQQAFAGQLLSLVTEGVFREFPALKVVLVESGDLGGSDRAPDRGVVTGRDVDVAAPLDRAEAGFGRQPSHLLDGELPHRHRAEPGRDRSHAIRSRSDSRTGWSGGSPRA
jgi:predicted TIM-barrel fold metal-dependent hydrolase